jgi:tripeptide aminopeptidase
MATIAPDTEAILQTFLEMVRIDSPSGGEEQMRAYLEERLAALGIAYQVDRGGNLIADIPKHRCNHDKVLVLSGHMDVVPPCHGIKPSVVGEGENRMVVSDHTTVLGADDKSALAPILEVVALALRENLPRPPLRLIFTTREETFLGGAKDLADDVLQADFAVIFDHTGKQGTIIHQAPSYIEFNIECTGKSVHAGIMPEKGVNAIVYAARVIERLHLGRIDGMTTSNIGFIDGGKGTNVVPDRVKIRGELRGHDMAVLEHELAHMRQVLEEEKAAMPGADFTFRHEVEFYGYRIEADHPGMRRVIEATCRAGLEPHLIVTNGGSDNNIFVRRGLSGVVLSAGFIEPHSLHERVKVSEMRQCAELTVKILECFAADDI